MSQRNRRQAISEVREGTTYSSGVALTGLSDVEEIPPPCNPPILKNLNPGKYKFVVFDLETTGLGVSAGICQLAAVSETSSFDCYVLPTQPIQAAASRVTGLTTVGSTMLLNGRPVHSVSIMAGLSAFLSWIESQSQQPIVLVGHNCKTFDCRILIRHLKECGLLKRFDANVVGYVDTLPLFRKLLPGKSSYRQESLVDVVIGNRYNAHNAVGDVKALQQLITVSKVSDSHMIEHSFSTDHVVKSLTYLNAQKTNLHSLQPLVRNKVLSENMAKKIAGSGLKLCHLALAFQRNGINGLQSVLADDSCGTIRVTNRKKFVENIAKYLSLP